MRAAHRALLDWYAREGRDLPWRRTRDPYAVLVSEIMLQQTQVDRVIPRWREWLDQFPTLAALAAAPRAEVIRAWRGLGYNLRAVRLHDLARTLVAERGGRFPRALSDLRALPGLGPYTAAALACFAFGERVAPVDTNVRRVLGRLFLGEPAVARGQEAAIAALAEAALPEDAYSWNQALMDLGATICTADAPACLICPVRDPCRAAGRMSGWPLERRERLREARAGYDAAARQRASQQRVYRGRLVDALRTAGDGAPVPLGALGARVKPDFDVAGEADRAWLEGLARKLGREGLLRIVEAEDGSLVGVLLPEELPDRGSEPGA